MRREQGDRRERLPGLERAFLIASLYFIAESFGQLAATPLQRTSPSPSSGASEHSHSDSDLNHRGARVMGFNQQMATHHFRLSSEGGVIEVEANDAMDLATRDRIRMHLAHIARSFTEGDFRDPMNVHNEVPSGAREMRRLQKQFQYTFENTERGGRVVIRTASPEAIQAAHKFLIFQIRKHHTGDPNNIPER